MGAQDLFCESGRRAFTLGPGDMDNIQCVKIFWLEVSDTDGCTLIQASLLKE